MRISPTIPGPLAVCGNESCQTGVVTLECMHCATDSVVNKLRCCSRCQKLRCEGCAEIPEAPTNEAFLQLKNAIKTTNELSRSTILSCYDTLVSTGATDATSNCVICSRGVCIECLDFTEQRILARTFWAIANNVEYRYSDGFYCSHCYWTTKSCTNPFCPNEVGVPTKRCGGCHIDRYCSVECQAAAYPAHVGRCKRIQEKRAAAGKDACNIE